MSKTKSVSLKNLQRDVKKAYDENDFKSVLKICKTAFKQAENHPNDAKCKKSLYYFFVIAGAACTQLGILEQAEMSYQKAIDTDSQNVMAWVGLYELYQKKSCVDLSKQVNVLQKLTELTDSSKSKWRHYTLELGSALSESGRYSDAKICLQSLIPVNNIQELSVVYDLLCFVEEDTEMSHLSIRVARSMNNALVASLPPQKSRRGVLLQDSTRENHLKAINLLCKEVEQCVHDSLERFYRPDRDDESVEVQTKQQSSFLTSATAKYLSPSEHFVDIVLPSVERVLSKSSFRLPRQSILTHLSHFEQEALSSDFFHTLDSTYNEYISHPLLADRCDSSLYAFPLHLAYRFVRRLQWQFDCPTLLQSKRDYALGVMLSVCKRSADVSQVVPNSPFARFAFRTLCSLALDSSDVVDNTLSLVSLMKFMFSYPLESLPFIYIGSNVSPITLDSFPFRLETPDPASVQLARAFLQRGLSWGMGACSMSGWCTLSLLECRQRCWQAALDTAKRGMECINQHPGSGSARFRAHLQLTVSEVYIGLRKLQKAASFFHKVLQTDSTNTRALKGVCDCALQRIPPEYEVAQDFCHRLLKIDGNNDWAWSMLGSISIELNNLSLAQQYLEKAAKLSPHSATHLLRLGKLYWSMGGVYRSTKHFCYSNVLKAAQIDPSLHDAYAYLGHYYKEAEENIPQAEKCYAQCLKYDPSNHDAGNALVRIYQGSARTELAFNVLCAAVKHNSTAKWAWLYLASYYLNIGNYSEAVVSYHHALRSDPSDYVCWRELGRAYQFQGKYVASIKSLTRCVALRPDLTYSIFLLAEAKLLNGSVVEAISLLETLLSNLSVSILPFEHICPPILDSSEYSASSIAMHVPLMRLLSEALYQNAIIHRDLGLFAESASIFQRSLSILYTCLLNAPRPLACLYKLFGDICLDCGRLPPSTGTHDLTQIAPAQVHNLVLEQLKYFGIAGAAFTAALKIFPATASLWHDRGVANLFCHSICPPSAKSAYMKQANHCFLNALTIDPESSLFWCDLGLANTDPTIKQHCFIKALQIDPKFDIAWNYLAFFYLQYGDRYLARCALQRSQSLNPDSTGLWLGQGLFNWSVHVEKAFDQACASCERALEAGHNYLARFCMGYTSWACGNLERAQFALRNCVSAIPFDACAHNLYGLILEAQGQLPDALEQFQIALHLLQISSQFACLGCPPIENEVSVPNFSHGQFLAMLSSKRHHHLSHVPPEGLGVHEVQLNMARVMCSLHMASGLSLYRQLHDECSSREVYFSYWDFLLLGNIYFERSNAPDSEWAFHMASEAASCANVAETDPSHCNCNLRISHICVNDEQDTGQARRLRIDAAIASALSRTGQVNEAIELLQKRKEQNSCKIALLGVLFALLLKSAQPHLAAIVLSERDALIKQAKYCIHHGDISSKIQAACLVDQSFLAIYQKDPALAKRFLMKAVHRDPSQLHLRLYLASLLVDLFPHQSHAVFHFIPSPTMSADIALWLVYLRAGIAIGCANQSLAWRLIRAYPANSTSWLMLAQVMHSSALCLTHHNCHIEAANKYGLAVSLYSKYMTLSSQETPIELNRELSMCEAARICHIQCLAFGGKLQLAQDQIAAFEWSNNLHTQAFIFQLKGYLTLLSDYHPEARSSLMENHNIGMESITTALSDFGAAIRCDPTNSEFWEEYASVLTYKLSEYDMGYETCLVGFIRFATSCPAISPSSLHRCFLRLARFRYFSKQYRTGIDAAAKALNFWPFAPAANLLSGMFFKKTRNWDLSEQRFFCALSNSSPPYNLVSFNLGQLQLRMKNAQKAECWLLSEAAITPTLSATYWQLAVVWVTSKKKVEAIRSISKAIKLKPTLGVYWTQLRKLSNL